MSLNEGINANSSIILSDDMVIIKELVDSAVNLIRDEMNFLKYYNIELEDLRKRELRCFENNNGLYKLILSVYASYEFTVKRMFEYVLEIIDKEEISISDLNVNIKALYFKEDLDDLRKKINPQSQQSNQLIKEEISKKVVRIFSHFEEDNVFTTKDNMINTKSNLKIEVLLEIIYYFDIEKSLIMPYDSYIKTLVHHRNNIAHGNQRFADSLPQYIMPINVQNYERLCEAIIKLINELYNHLEVYVNQKKYLR
ncbi:MULTISPECIES: MAE_28990/MAE_18760 family HEPN-like nuclease [unclassified Lysinibacillus]|uniref:MAE_28990/MAE_18760 family HEPN-like nuclease n=1 Tax=unclassified Lysinibacillus TaxID=2636778 RepID=UPI003820962A